jgi:hypothetical protein
LSETSDRLYVYRPSQTYLNEVADEEADDEDSPDRNVQGDEIGESFLVDSVAENKIGFTKNSIMHWVVENFKHILRQTSLRTVPSLLATFQLRREFSGQISEH